MTWTLDELLAENLTGEPVLGLRDALGEVVRDALGLPSDGVIVFMTADDHALLMRLCRALLTAGAEREGLERISEALETKAE